MDHFKVLEDNAWSLVCVDTDGEGFMWMVIGHYIAKPTKRVVGESWEEDNPRPRLKMLSIFKAPTLTHTNMLLRDSDEK